MSRTLSIAVLALILGLVAVLGWAVVQGAGNPGEAGPVGDGFTYQGRLIDGGSPAEGAYDLTFELHRDPTADDQVGPTVTKDDVQVSDGLFSTQLDFGKGRFKGKATWLEIGIRPGSSTGSYTTLNPRQELTPTPYALALPGLYTLPNATSSNVVGGFGGNSVTDGVVGAVIGGGGATTTQNRVTDDYGTVSGGSTNLAGNDTGTTKDAGHATVGGGGSNQAKGSHSTVGGGELNVAAAYPESTDGQGWTA